MSKPEPMNKLSKTQKARIKNKLDKKRNSDNPNDCPIQYAYVSPDVRRFLTKEETAQLEEMIESIKAKKAARMKHDELLELVALHAYELSIDSSGTEEQAQRSKERKLAKKERTITEMTKEEIEAEIAELTLAREKIALSMRRKQVKKQGFEITKKRKITKKAM